MIDRQALPDEAVAELSDMAIALQRPALGWWRQHAPARAPLEAPDCPVPLPRRDWADYELVLAASDWWPPDMEIEDRQYVLAKLATDHGCGVDALSLAYAAMEES